LYWAPVASFPVPSAQRSWLLEFLGRLCDQFGAKHSLRSELFLQVKTTMDIQDEFIKSASRFLPFLGLSRKPGDGPPRVPTKEDLLPYVRSLKEYDLKDLISDYCYWFVKKEIRQELREFFGLGGMTVILLKPDPKTVPPALPFTPAFREKFPVLDALNVDGLVATGCSLQDSFLARSKELFGSDLKDHMQYPGILFIVPLLGSTHFFACPESECEKWFQLFDVYINESPADKGIMLAFKNDYEDLLLGVLDEMRAAGLAYPEG
jgi:hypothetical protein